MSDARRADVRQHLDTALIGRRAAKRADRSVEPEHRDDDLGSLLHEGLGRLPERYRRSVVPCHLEGLTHERAAHQPVWPVGTVRSRLARGRDRLRSRPERRGLAPSAGLLGGGRSPRGRPERSYRRPSRRSRSGG